MEFTEKKLSLIAKAKKKIATALGLRVVIVVAIIAGIALMFAGILSTEEFVYGIVFAVIFSSLSRSSVAAQSMRTWFGFWKTRQRSEV